MFIIYYLVKIINNFDILYNMLCKYKDALGKPKTGIHSYRIFNIAIADLIIASLIISYFFKFNF